MEMESFMRKHLMAVKTGFAAAVVILVATGCSQQPVATERGLVGAWRGQVQFTTGAFAHTKDLDFMYAFHAGGTLTESSNYDGAPPVPPAYGVWRKVGERTYRAKYEYYTSKAPASFEEIAKGGGWSPGGYGVLTQEIVLATDGNSFESTLKYEVFDPAGKPVEKESTAAARGTRISF